MHEGIPIWADLLMLVAATAVTQRGAALVQRARAPSPRWRQPSAQQQRLLARLPFVIVVLAVYTVLIVKFGLQHRLGEADFPAVPLSLLPGTVRAQDR